MSSAKQEDTINDQIAWARKTAAENGWTIANVFRGVSSGRDGTRKLLEELLDQLRATAPAMRPERVLMIRIDRLGRGDGLDTIAAIAEIRRLGTLIHTRTEGDVRIERATDALLPAIRSIIGGLENEVRRDKSLNAHAKRRELGLSWRAPYGLMRTAENKLIPKEPQASVIRELFELRLRGTGYCAIGRIMRERDSARGWGRSVVYDALHRESYRGTLISSEKFDAVGQMVGTHFSARAVQRWPWPLAKALRCAECGQVLHGTATGKPRWRKRYYICDNLKQHPGIKSFLADDIEAQFSDLLTRLSARDGLRIPTIDDQALESIRARLRSCELELRQNEASRQAAWDVEGKIDAAQLRDRLAYLATRHAIIEASVATLRTELVAAQTIKRTSADATRLVARAATVFDGSETLMQQAIAQALSRLLGGLWVSDARPDRARGPRALRNSARGTLQISPSRLSKANSSRVDGSVQGFENMREINTLRDVDMQQRKADDTITKKFIESIGQ